MDARSRLEDLLAERIVLLDGAWGVLLQGKGLSEEDFRGERFAGHDRDVKGDPDLLNLSRPDIVTEIHEAYFEAGADITTTNTFTATSIGQADYGLQDAVRDMNLEGARLAKAAADRHGGLVAGSVGPLNVTLSLSPKVEDPSFRTVSFDDVYEAYANQIEALREGGADLLLIETIFDTLNAKAAIAAAMDVAPDLPRWISVTIVDRSGRTLSGQTVEAFWTSVAHADPVTVGVNCSLGAREMRPSVEALATVAPVPVASYPNAGLPNAFGGFDETPEITSSLLGEFAAAGLVNIVGGCCGTTPAHIRAIHEAVRDLPPRAIPGAGDFTSFSGLEPFRITPETGFVTVGERTNITGSKRFARLIESGDFQAAVDVARDQVENGANLIDVNMDTDMIDGAAAMTRFLNLVATEPEIAKVPAMIDSSKWDVIEAGLKCVQGKSVVNSISLKEGEDDFLAKASKVRRYGASVVVMCFDERGQADTVARKVEIAERSVRLLIERAGFDASDIIVDPNILAVATGLEEHNGYAKAFIEATREIKHRLPGVKVSGGVSNLSFSFRGNEPVRRAMHSAFLYHAIAAGLDMAIVNAGQLDVYEDIPADLLEHVEDVIFDRRPDATERLVSFAETVQGSALAKEEDLSWRDAPVQERLSHALVHGIDRWIEEDTEEARRPLRPAARRDRGPPDGGDADRRRSVRRRQDVPAAGRQERPGDEEGRRVPRAVHGGREAAVAGERRHRARAGQGDLVHREGRRPRHREEHRRRRLGLQQLRGHRPRRDGAGRRAARHGDRTGLQRGRLLGTDHPLARRDGARREGDGAPGPRPAVADRRGDDLAAAHRRADRTRVRAPRDPRGRRLPRGRRGLGAARSRAEGDARRSEPGAAGASSRPARGAGEDPPAPDTDRRRTAHPDRVGRRRRRGAGLHRGTLGRTVAGGASAVLRLDLLLRGLGAEGLVPADPSSTLATASRRASCSRTRTSCSTRSSSTARSRRAARTASGRRTAKGTTSSWRTA